MAQSLGHTNSLSRLNFLGALSTDFRLDFWDEVTFDQEEIFLEIIFSMQIKIWQAKVHKITSMR